MNPPIVFSNAVRLSDGKPTVTSVIIIEPVGAGNAVGITGSLPECEQGIWSPLLKFVIGNGEYLHRKFCCSDVFCFNTPSFSILP